MRQLLVALAAAALWLSAAMAQDYLLRPGDRIEITVLEDPGLNRTVLVRPDGKVSLPLAGTIDAAGRTPEAVQGAIRRALSRDFVEPPTVTVSLTSLGEGVIEDFGAVATIYILGEVARPGPYEVILPIDALQALALAGGAGPFAAQDRIQIRRRGLDGGERVFLFDYALVEEGATPSQIIRLANGDVMVVPERGLFE